MREQSPSIPINWMRFGDDGFYPTIWDVRMIKDYWIAKIINITRYLTKGEIEC